MRLVIVIVLIACGSKSDPGPTCAQVMDHILEITQQQLVGHGDEIKSQRAAMIAQCEQRNMPAEMRRCLLDSKTRDAIATCHAKDAPFEKPRKPLPKRGSN